ncbi:hypothetical protein HMPREF1493_0552 [Atopobium sp. ICM42b]|nr:hypothetical protein HMPREF1493_0552 [Atopobium sp. ICM42b]
MQRICVWDTDSLMKSGRIHRFFDVFRQTLQILCRNQARLVQALQIGYFSRRDELLAMRRIKRFSHRSPLAARRGQQNHRLTCDF